MISQEALVAAGAAFSLIVMVGGVAVALGMEALAPRRVRSGPRLWRWINNLGLAAVNEGLLYAVAPFAVAVAMSMTGGQNIGLLPRLGVSSLTAFVATVLCLEFAGYWIHRLFHAVPVLWRIHAVHHADVDVDATTAHRHHPLEPLIVTALLMPVVLLLGPAPTITLFYGFLRTSIAAFSHANLRLSEALEQALGWVVVTPDFHRVHHSAVRPFTDSNFSNTVPLFDHLFGTARSWSDAQQTSMRLGLEYWRDPVDSRIDRLLVAPLAYPSRFGRDRVN